MPLNQLGELLEGLQPLPSARTMAGLPEGTRVSDHIGLGVVTKTFPLPLIRRLLFSFLSRLTEQA